MAEARPVGRFPAARRVRKRPEFQEIQARARRVSTPCFVLLLRARPTATGARLGITASRRVGNAVVRSRAKRLVREAFRASRDLWADDIDLVVIVKKAPPGLGLQQVVDQWRAVSRLLQTRTAEARKDRDRGQSEVASGSQKKQTRPV